MAKELPGFYFDEEKQKYFKIQPNHVAPKGSRYAKDAIDVEKEASLVCSLLSQLPNARNFFIYNA